MKRELLFSPREQPFYKHIRNMSVAIGLHRTRDNTSRLARYSRTFSKMQIVLNIVWSVLFILYAFNHSDDSFEDKGLYYITIILSFVLLIREVMSQTDIYQEQYTKYMDELHMSNYTYHDEKTTQILHNTERLCYFLFYILRLCLIIGPTSFICTPVLLNWIDGAFDEGSNKELRTGIYMSMPFDYKHNIRNWLLYSVFVAYQANLMSYVGMYYDQFMMCVAFQILGHIKVCVHKLRCLHSDDVLLTPEEDDRVFVELRRIVEHHNLIIRSLERLKGAFGFSMLGNYTNGAIGFCLMLLLISSNWPLSGLKYGTLAVTIFCLLIGETFIIENLSTAMSDLHEAIYTVPWTAMSQRNKKIVYVMLLVSQKEFVFKALGVTNINMQAMASILKAAVSYFIWLNAMNE